MPVTLTGKPVSFDPPRKFWTRAECDALASSGLPGRRMIVHRDPRDGRYKSVVAYRGEESVAPLAAPDSALRVKDAFSG